MIGTAIVRFAIPFLIAAAPLISAAAADDNSFLLRGATIHTMAGRDIENGSILVRNGKIAGVGQHNGNTIQHQFARDRGPVNSSAKDQDRPGQGGRMFAWHQFKFTGDKSSIGQVVRKNGQVLGQLHDGIANREQFHKALIQRIAQGTGTSAFR